jgi:hypothetical protein
MGQRRKRTMRNIIQEIQMSSSYSWRPRTENLGVTRNQVVLGLRKVTAMRQLKADHPITKPPSPKYIKKYRHKTKYGLDKGRNKRNYMVLYVLEKVSQTATRKCMKYGDNEIQTGGCTWKQRNS